MDDALQQLLGKDLLDGSNDLVIRCLSEEVLLEVLACEGTLHEVAVEVAQELRERTEVRGAHRIEDLLVALLGLDALCRIAIAGAEAEELLERVLEVELLAPAVLEGEGHGDSVAVIDLGKGVGIERVLDMSADDAGEGVEREHGAFAGAAAGDHIVCCLAVQKRCGKDAVLDIGELGSVVCGIHAVVEVLMSHRLCDLAQCLLDHGIQ